MSAKDIKRQDHIWELIQTERSHCRTLKIMQNIFSRGMRHEAGMSQDMIDRIFPRLGDLLDIHSTFLHRLREKQRLRSDRHIEDVGDVLVQQFDGEMGERMKIAYGSFCSRHAMAVQLYKDILKSDRKFQTFIKKCSRSTICKRLSIPECILLVTQRVTKYPLLIEPIIKTTKDNRNDKERLLRALPLMREILIYIDAQVDAHEKEQRLIEIYNKLDARSYALYMGDKFKKSNLLGSRKLIHEGSMKWMTARGKTFEVLAVILSDVMFFLAENNQKLTFFSQDSKSSVVPLSKLLVREKGDTRDSKGIYLIWQSKTEPEMYEFVCRSAEERKTWIKTIRAAVLRCMEAEGVDVSRQPELEGEKKELEAKSARIRQLVDRLYERDSVVRQTCDEKMSIIIEMLEVFCKDEINKNLQSMYKDEEGPEGLDLEVWSALKDSIQDSSQFLSMVLLGSPGISQNTSTTTPSHHTDISTPNLPKRAETFSGFDQKEKVKKRYNSGQLDESERSDSQLSLNETETISHTTSNGSTGKEKTRSRNTSFLQGLLKTSAQDSDVDKSSTEPESHDLHNNMAAGLQELLVLPSREQCESLAQLMQYLHNLVCITSNQLTEVEKFRAQLKEANSKVSTLYAENKRLSHGFHHDKQLEILREQQEVLRQERIQLDNLRDFDRREREDEHAKLLKLKEEFEIEKAELRSQKEEMQHQKEVLQRQMDLFEENKRRMFHTDSPKGLAFRERSESPASRAVSPSSQDSHSSQLDVSHRRSGSDDLTHGPSPERSLPDKDGSKTRVSGSTAPVRRDSNNPLPIHLLSATNEQKLGQVSQQLPYKLAALGGGGGGKTTPQQAQQTPPSVAPKPQAPSGVQQMFPFKLSSSSAPQSAQIKPSHPGSGSPRTQPVAKSATLDSSTRSHTQRTLVSVGRTSSGTRMPAASLSNHGSMLPMKLAEKQRPKSASSASSASVTMATSPAIDTETSSSHSHKRSSSSVRAKEEEVIYF